MSNKFWNKEISDVFLGSLYFALISLLISVVVSGVMTELIFLVIVISFVIIFSIVFVMWAFNNYVNIGSLAERNIGLTMDNRKCKSDIERLNKVHKLELENIKNKMKEKIEKSNSRIEYLEFKNSKYFERFSRVIDGDFPEENKPFGEFSKDEIEILIEKGILKLTRTV